MLEQSPSLFYKDFPKAVKAKLRGLNHVLTDDVILSLCRWYQFNDTLKNKYRLHQVNVSTLMLIIYNWNYKQQGTSVYCIQKNVDKWQTIKNTVSIRDRLYILMERGLVEQSVKNGALKVYTPTLKALQEITTLSQTV
jgi:hypothetical protein